MSRACDVNPAPRPDTASAARDEEERIPLGHCNKLVILRSHERVAGSWIVNPALSTPAAMMAGSIPSRAAGANLWLESGTEGVSATVRVVDAAPPLGDCARTELVFSGRGAVTVRLLALGNLPCRITAVSSAKDVDIRIPADFVGVVTTQCHSSARPTLPRRRCRPLSEIDGNGWYFIGEEPSAAHVQDSWNGTTLDIRAHAGRIRVGFVSPESSLTIANWIRSSAREGHAVIGRIPKGVLVLGIAIFVQIAIALSVLWVFSHRDQTQFPL